MPGFPTMHLGASCCQASMVNRLSFAAEEDQALGLMSCPCPPPPGQNRQLGCEG